MNNGNITCNSSLKFLGLVWHSKLAWREYLTQLRNGYLKAMNLLKTVSSVEWGANQESVLRLYKSNTFKIGR